MKQQFSVASVCMVMGIRGNTNYRNKFEKVHVAIIIPVMDMDSITRLSAWSLREEPKGGL